MSRREQKSVGQWIGGEWLFKDLFSHFILTFKMLSGDIQCPRQSSQVQWIDSRDSVGIPRRDATDGFRPLLRVQPSSHEGLKCEQKPLHVICFSKDHIQHVCYQFHRFHLHFRFCCVPNPQSPCCTCCWSASVFWWTDVQSVLWHLKHVSFPGALVFHISRQSSFFPPWS